MYQLILFHIIYSFCGFAVEHVFQVSEVERREEVMSLCQLTARLQSRLCALLSVTLRPTIAIAISYYYEFLSECGHYRHHRI